MEKLILCEERDGVFRDQYGNLIHSYRVSELFEHGGYTLEGYETL